MKKLLFILLIIAPRVYAQDSTKVLNVAIQAKLVEFLTYSLVGSNNPESLNAIIKWRTAIRVSKAQNTTAITIDTISTPLLASLYSVALTAPDGFGMGALMKTQIATKRATNTYLDRLCKSYEDELTAALTDKRARARKFLLGQ